jgi:dTDP-glucose pyrophosphorylase
LDKPDLLTKKKPQDPVVDWQLTPLYSLAISILSLPPKNKAKKTKELELNFFNPGRIDIFTEQESIYNDSLLKKKSVNEFSLKDDQYEEFILDELH